MLQATGLPAPGARRPELLALVLVTLLAAAPLFAASAGDLYTAALTQEHALRAVADEPATLEQLRDTIAAFEDIVLQYPRSGYSDNALWQAAGLAIEAFGRYRRPVDRERGVRFLEMIVSEYPSSSLIPGVPDRVAQFDLDPGLDLDTEPVQLRTIRREPLADVVRVTMELDDDVPHVSERLDEPPRLYFDLHGTAAAPPLHNADLTFDDGDIVRRIRVGHHPEQTTRIVLDIENVDTYHVYTLYRPYRLVVDMVPIPAVRTTRAPSTLPPAAEPTDDLDSGVVELVAETDPADPSEPVELTRPPAAVSPGEVSPLPIPYRGVLTGSRGGPITGRVSTILALYEESAGGVPLWADIQTVQTGPGGEYTVVLGGTTPLPADLFATDVPRWLGVQPDGENEQPRVRITDDHDVPTAKGADAASWPALAEHVVGGAGGEGGDHPGAETVDSLSPTTNEGAADNAAVGAARVSGGLQLPGPSPR